MTETPKYTVMRKDGDIELRRYLAYIQAEVEIEESSYRGAIFKGFVSLRIIFLEAIKETAI